jgi:hypothetical protein
MSEGPYRDIFLLLEQRCNNNVSKYPSPLCSISIHLQMKGMAIVNKTFEVYTDKSVALLE